MRTGLRRAGTKRWSGEAGRSQESVLYPRSPGMLTLQPAKPAERSVGSPGTGEPAARVSGSRSVLRAGFRERSRAACANRSPESRNGAMARRSGRITREGTIAAFPWQTNPSTSGAGRSEAARAGGAAGRGPERNPGSRRAPCRGFGEVRVESPARQNKRRAFRIPRRGTPESVPGAEGGVAEVGGAAGTQEKVRLPRSL